MDAKTIRKRKKELKRVSKTLKKKFIGIDIIIDQIIENITVWYVTPEILTRPVIINLWGLTGVGKTDLVRTLVKELNFVDNFVEVQLSNKNDVHGRNSVEGILGCSSIEAQKPGILLFDEMQRFRTIDDKGHEILNYKFSDVWVLLSDGKFANSYNRKEALLDILFSSLYWNQIAKEDAEAEIDIVDEKNISETPVTEGETPKPKKKKKIIRKYHQSYWNATQIKKLLKLEEDVKSIMEWSNDKKETIIYDAFDDNTVTEGEMYSKLLIFISGNLDEAYTMASSTEDADIDADIFHEFSLKIDLIKIKEVLKKRFKPEQISRLGNTHIIYPSLSKSNYIQIIKNSLKALVNLIYNNNKIKITIDESVVDFIYRNGVFPAQGVRPVLSTIVSVVENTLPFFLLYTIEKNIKVIDISYSNTSKSLVANIGGVTKKHKINGVIDKIKTDINKEWQVITAIHEAGHAIVYALLFGLAPTQIKSKTAFSGGFVAHHDIIPTKERLLDKLVSILGGQSAEEVVFGDKMKSHGCSADIYQATTLASHFVRDYAMDGYQSQILNSNCAPDNNGNFNIDATNNIIEEILKTQKERAVGLLEGNLQLLKEVASVLLTSETLSPETFKKILAKHNIKIRILSMKKKVIKGYARKFNEWKNKI